MLFSWIINNVILKKEAQEYADIISEYAIPVLEEKNIKYQYETKVDYIRNKDNTGMCLMENKFKDEKDIKKIYEEVIGIGEN